MTDRRYEIRVDGLLDDTWADWFDNVDICLHEAGYTSFISGSIDQATLHGVLKKIRDLGLTILIVRQINEAGE